MFGKRSSDTAPRRLPQHPVSSPAPATSEPKVPAVRTAAPSVAPSEPQRRHSEEYYDVKTTVFNALIDTIDLTQLAKLDVASAREEIRHIVS